MPKKLFSRKEFEQYRIGMAAKMAADKPLRKKAQDVLVEADKLAWIHQTNWLGEPILNVAQDMFATQEILWKTKPDFIIESGVAWGGSLLFYATIMEAMGKGRIIGIDTYIPADLKKRIMSHGKISKRITLINASSTDPATIAKVKSLTKGAKNISVFLDSDHSHAHVLKELELYSAFVKKGNYMLCGDTIVESIPEQTHRKRSWGPGNNPKTARDEFMKKNKRFVVDAEFENKLLFTCNPEGFLKCIK